MRIWPRRSVAVTDLARLEVCEQQLVLERRYGKRMTAEQRRRAEVGGIGHERQDRVVRYYSNIHAWWLAARSAVWVGTPLTLLSLFVSQALNTAGAGVEKRALNRLAELLVGPGQWWVDLQGPWNTEATAFAAVLGFVAVQFAFYAVLAYVVQTIFAPRRKVTT